MNSTLSVPSSSSANQPVRRQPRGSINRRACQKCRHLKIKCDGDAENNLSCSNCDYGTCVYDKSPRKNRQVERLNSKVENLENTLTETQTNLEIIHEDYIKKTEELETLKMEKQILNLLFDCHNLFTDPPIVFNQLRQAINESRCWTILLPVIHTLLTRLSQNNNDTNSITAMLTTIAENTMNYCNPDNTYSSSLQQNLILEEVMAQMNLPSNQSFNATTSTTTENVSTGMANLALRSPDLRSPVSDAGSDMSNLTLPDYKIDLITSPLLTPNPNIDITSPLLTPADQEAAYFSQSGSEYGNSPVSTSVNDYTSIDFAQTNFLFDFGGVYDVPSSSYGSNSSGQ